MNKSSFAIAKLKQQSLKLRLRAFMDGRAEIQEAEAISPRDCDLGKWLYGEGLMQYRAYPEMQKLEREHAQMHAQVHGWIQQAGQTARKLAPWAAGAALVSGIFFGRKRKRGAGESSGSPLGSILRLAM